MNGILLIDKEPGWTSNDVVAKLKGILHERRIGHSGTLDPMATGLLVVFVGRATRGVEFAESHSKRYTAHLRLGTVTDTQDTSGTILSQKKVNVSPEEFKAVLHSFTGEISQIPPMYSAIKINGRRLYDIARSGGEVERKARKIFIGSIEEAGREGEDYILNVSCSKGTYIRTLCHDIGSALGCGGCMSSLRRTAVGSFGIENAHKLSEIQQAADDGEAEKYMLPVDCIFSEYPECTADSAQEMKIRCGNCVKCSLSDGKYRVYSKTGEFLMLGMAKQGVLKTIKSFFEV